MNVFYVIVQVAVVLALIHKSSALFYTSSKENDYPRIGKRPIASHIVPTLDAKDLRDLIRNMQLHNGYTTPVYQRLPRPMPEVTSSMELPTSDLGSSETLDAEIEDLLEDNPVTANKGLSDYLNRAVQTWLDRQTRTATRLDHISRRLHRSSSNE